LSNQILLFSDWLLSFFRSKRVPIPENPQKILLCNIANLGDVVISTTVLPLIKKRYPNCEIGFLVSSAAEIAIQNHPLVSRIHVFDHWYISTYGKCKAALHHWTHSRKAIKELRQARYDISINLYSYFPNALPLLARARIPVRIGYTTGGFSSQLTHPMKWDFADRYVGCAHLHLLTALGIEIAHESPLPSYDYKKNTSDYVVIHMGSSSRVKEWEMAKWIQLIRQIEKSGIPVLLTGKGEQEQLLCNEVASQTGSKNLCNRLNWPDFVSTIQEASLLIAVDSVTVHIAAGTLTPTIVIFAGVNSPHMWVPPAASCKPMMHRVPCAPCFNKSGCSSMLCIRGIAVTDVFQHVKSILTVIPREGSLVK
jgi:ADP-heptose:LPS heptosyltransferase